MENAAQEVAQQGMFSDAVHEDAASRRFISILRPSLLSLPIVRIAYGV